MSRVDNPVAEIDDYRMEVLIRVPQLDTLDKEDFAPEDKQDALVAYDERREEFDLEDAVPDEEVLAVVYCLTRSVGAGFGRHCMPPPASNDTIGPRRLRLIT